MMTAFPEGNTLALPSSASKVRCSGAKSRSVPNLVAGGSSPSSGGDTAQSDSDSDSGSSEAGFRPSSKSPQAASSFHRRDRRRVACSPSGSRTPWCKRLHREQLAKMQNQVHKFIVLENVAAQFQVPCILDLKMGTRVHGDDASDAKRQSQIRKCETTTSSQLGLRLCGMKVIHQLFMTSMFCQINFSTLLS